jgi:hypothetical protein
MRNFALGCSLVLAACGNNSGATPPDSSAADGPAGGDAPPADAPSGATCAGLAYCDDFESYGTISITNNATVGPWKASVVGATIGIDATNGYHGGNALHITMPAGATMHGTLSQMVASGLVSDNNLFGRAMIYYSNTGGNDLPKNVHSWFFQTAGMSSEAAAVAQINMGGGGPDAQPQLNYHPGDISKRGSAMTAGQWHCIQWQYDGSGTTPADTAKVWIDGSPAVDVPASVGWKMATPWTSMEVGFTHYQTTTNPVEVFLDDFAVDGAMIACPP